MSNQVPFGSVCDLQNGRAFKPSEWSDEGTPIVRIQNLNDESKPFNYCNFDVEKRFHVNSGDLLFSWSGTPGTSFGAFFWNRGKGFLNQHIFRVDVDERATDKNYLRHAINSKLNMIIDQAHGGVGLKHITKGKLEAIEIYYPSFPEQKRIAAILDKADAIRRKRQQAIELADQFLRSVFLDLFGDPLRWDVGNPKDGWAVKPIEEIAHLKRGYDLPVQSRIEGEIPVFAANGVVGYHDTAKVCGPGVITGRSGTLGSVQYAETGFWPLNTTLYVTDFHGNEPKYIEWFLRMYKLDRFHRGAGVPTLNRNLFLKELSLVPPADLQERFVAILRNILTLKDRLEDAAEVRLFESLSQRTFAGYI